VNPRLSILLIEDREDVARRILGELGTAYEVTDERVETAAAMHAALAAHHWDLVVSASSMARFDGLSAFEILRAVAPDVPFILVCDEVDDDLAIEALRAGVCDVLEIDRLVRLAPLVARQLRHFQEQQLLRAHEAEIAWQRAQLELLEQQQRAIIDAVPEGVMVMDSDGRIQRSNRALLAFGFQPDEPATHEVRARPQAVKTDKLTPIPRGQLPGMRALRGEAVDGEELFVRHALAPDGVWASVSARPLRGADGAIVGAVSTFRDTTKERAAQEQLMTSDRMASIGILAAGVGHEINNPLAAALMNLELIKLTLHERRDDGLDGVREMLNDAVEGAERVKAIVKDLRIFARHEDVEVGAVNLDRVLDSALRMASNEIRHRARLECMYAGMPLVHGSESRLGQVFLNLIVNAAQAIEPGDAGRNVVTVTAAATPSTVVVSISDTGAGIPPHILARLFTPFVTSKPVGVGTGLGLAICQRIVTGFGGDISVTTEVGKGTTFRVTLPIASATHRPRAARGSGVPIAARRGRILIIDDDVIVATAIARSLESHEVRVETRARDGLEQILGQRGYDLVICDLMMPDMTGMELHAALSDASPGDADRLVFITGGTFTASAQQFLDRVSNPRLEKPFDPLELQALVASRMQ
jgi:PAS domain S-box-containing protein